MANVRGPRCRGVFDYDQRPCDTRANSNAERRAEGPAVAAPNLPADRPSEWFGRGMNGLLLHQAEVASPGSAIAGRGSRGGRNRRPPRHGSAGDGPGVAVQAGQRPRLRPGESDG